ncbi:MAG: hypothetical protein FD159_810 [Syntrophaceae bacterium]|nr:MAG: hypothetical protein FD159_810 [Syntrophaceae bacterium]
MTVRYERSLNKESVDLLKSTGKLNFLIDGYETWIPDDPNAFDIHLREKNEIMIYHGGTRLITISLSNDSVKLSTDKSYSRVGVSYSTLMREWAFDDLVKKQKEYKDYLIEAARIAQNKFYDNKKEGWWSNRLSLYFGKNWDVEKEWLIFDREAVLGFKKRDEKSMFYEKMKEKYLVIRSKFRKDNPKIWGKEDLRKSFGDELDFLAIGPAKELFCIELKHGSYTSGIYWGPLQVSVYKDAFYEVVSSISDNIKCLVKQKIDLGLLPVEATKWLPDGKFKEVKAIVAIADFNKKSSSKDKIKKVQDELRNRGSYYVSVAKIEENGSGLNVIIS